MKPTDKELQYMAVFGCYVAVQTYAHIKAGNNPPDYELMRSFVEEAHAVAELSQEVQEWEPTPEEDNTET